MMVSQRNDNHLTQDFWQGRFAIHRFPLADRAYDSWQKHSPSLLGYQSVFWFFKKAPKSGLKLYPSGIGLKHKTLVRSAPSEGTWFSWFENKSTPRSRGECCGQGRSFSRTFLGRVEIQASFLCFILLWRRKQFIKTSKNSIGNNPDSKGCDASGPSRGNRSAIFSCKWTE